MTDEQRLARRIIKKVISYMSRDYGDFVMAEMKAEDNLESTDCEKQVTMMIHQTMKRL